MIGRMYHYVHALETRLFQMYELSLMKRKGSPFGSHFRRQLWRSPSETEDWVNIARFFDPDERILLIDVGANVGDFTSGFLSIYKNARFICFEPVTSTFARLAKRFSGETRVEAHQYAVSDADGSAVIHLQEDSTLCTLTQYTKDANEAYEAMATASEEIVCRRLDSLQFEKGDGRLFIKVDVQGFEIEVIGGGIDTLARADALLLECSFADEYENKEPSFSPACALLRECGLYPVVFQDYGRQISNYAFERDVLFVKRELLSKIWFRNYYSD